MNAAAKTVLLVDDAPANLQVVNSILKGTYRIQIATTGEKALKLANQRPAAIMISSSEKRVVLAIWLRKLSILTVPTGDGNHC
jgi:CheY-like chemotaxis protein